MSYLVLWKTNWDYHYHSPSVDTLKHSFSLCQKTGTQTVALGLLPYHFLHKTASLFVFCMSKYFPVRHLCPGRQSQLHPDLQHRLPLFRESLFHLEHQCWRTAFVSAFAVTFPALWPQHQPQWNPPRSFFLSCSWIHQQEQPWASFPKPHLHPGEQG